MSSNSQEATNIGKDKDKEMEMEMEKEPSTLEQKMDVAEKSTMQELG